MAAGTETTQYQLKMNPSRSKRPQIVCYSSDRVPFVELLHFYPNKCIGDCVCLDIRLIAALPA